MFQEEGGRVNVDSLTKAAAAAEGSEEHGKRAKVKCTSGGQVQGHCRCLPFNRLAPPPRRHALAAFRLGPDLRPLRPAELSRHRRGEGGGFHAGWAARSSHVPPGSAQTCIRLMSWIPTTCPC